MLARRDGDLAAAAGNGYALSNRERGAALFLYHHDGVAIIFTNFQFHALGFIHGALYALTGYAARDRASRSGQRTSGAAADGIPEEAAQNRAANRYRVYSRLGLNGGTITRIFSLSITTNWLGYILLGGVIFTADLVKLPPHWYISQTTLRIIGGVMLFLTLCYLFGCAFAKRRHLTIKGQRLVLPSWRFALLQMGVSAANWMAMGAIIWLLLGSEINYFLVLGVLLVSSIAGVIIHIPAGIGVLEAVFIAMLSGEEISKGAIIAALLAWRALYYFLPLLLATVAYLLLESRAKKLRQKNQRKLARE